MLVLSDVGAVLIGTPGEHTCGYYEFAGVEGVEVVVGSGAVGVAGVGIGELTS